MAFPGPIITHRQCLRWYQRFLECRWVSRWLGGACCQARPLAPPVFFWCCTCQIFCARKSCCHSSYCCVALIWSIQNGWRSGRATLGSSKACLSLEFCSVWLVKSLRPTSETRLINPVICTSEPKTLGCMYPIGILYSAWIGLTFLKCYWPRCVCYTRECCMTEINK